MKNEKNKFQAAEIANQADLPTGLDNFDEANIADIERAWADEDNNGNFLNDVYTMGQANTSSDAKITDESRKVWAKALLR